MIYDGVQLSTRTPKGGYGEMMRRVRAISAAYDVPASQTVTSLYLDDKVGAYYEVELNADIPADGWDREFAKEICELFRELGGYNGLIIRHRGKELINDGPEWPE